MFQWILKNYLEIAGVITGLISLYFSVQEKIWLWPFGIISSAIYIVIYGKAQLYADMGLNVYYVIISIYGWKHWLIQKDNVSHESIKISILTFQEWIKFIIITFILATFLALILLYVPQWLGFKPSSLPIWDAFLGAASVVATWMLAKKIIEQWLWWIIIDATSIGILLFKELNYTAILFGIYTIMAITGYLKWKKDLKLQ